MSSAELFTVSRTLCVDASAEEVWRLLTDDAELSRWFSDAATLDAVPGGLGRFVEGGTVRRAVVHSVERGRRLAFTWWAEDAPADASTVELVVDSSLDGSVQLTVTETLVPTRSGNGGIGALACSWTDAAESWEGRLGALSGRLALRVSPLAR